jgi:hypothetical protein
MSERSVNELEKADVPNGVVQTASPPAPEQAPTEFEQADADQGLLREFWQFLMENKKWWLAPILVLLLLFGLLLLLSGSAAAPFIYSLF